MTWSWKLSEKSPGMEKWSQRAPLKCLLVPSRRPSQSTIFRPVGPEDPPSWWTFRIFLIFFCSGRGKWESEAAGGGGGVRFFIEIPRRGGGRFPQEGKGRGAGKVSAANWGTWGGGGSKYCFFGAEMPSRPCWR